MSKTDDLYPKTIYMRRTKCGEDITDLWGPEPRDVAEAGAVVEVAVYQLIRKVRIGAPLMMTAQDDDGDPMAAFSENQ